MITKNEYLVIELSFFSILRRLYCLDNKGKLNADVNRVIKLNILHENNIVGGY
jgi:hypothetical protein